MRLRSARRKRFLQQSYTTLFFITSLYLGACEGQFDGSDDKHTTPVAPQQSSAPEPEKDVHYYNVDDFTYTLKGESEPHSYVLSVFWPKTQRTVSVSLNKKIVKVIKPEEGNSFIQSLPDKTKFQLQILSESDQPLKEWIFETPSDFVFNSTEILSQDIEVKANRVFFRSKSHIETRKFNLSVFADEIYFEEGAKIINFIEIPAAETQKDGVNGGDVKILARVALGKIEIELNGGDGGKGIKAFPFLPPASDGKNGFAGICRRDALVPSCIVQPTNGENSPSGRKGKTGFPGQKGGNSGRVIFEIAEQSEVEVIHTDTPGKGGEGGEGGIGQMKGRPGKAAPRDESCLCPQGNDGEDTGKNGETGDQGPEGNKGDTGAICISIGRGEGVCK
jgi:hypothetical protein